MLVHLYSGELCVLRKYQPISLQFYGTIPEIKGKRESDGEVRTGSYKLHTEEGGVMKVYTYAYFCPHTQIYCYVYTQLHLDL